MTQVLIDKDDAEVALTAIVAAYGASNKSATALRAALANAEPKKVKKREPTIDLGKYAGTYGGYITKATP